MATQLLKVRALVAVLCCASLLPVACGDDDDNGNPTPGTGGTGAKGGSAGKSSSSGGTGGSTSDSGGAPEGGSGDTTNTTGGTGGSAKGGSSGSAGQGTGGSKGGKGGGSSGGKGGSTGGTGETGNEGGSGDVGGAGAGNVSGSGGGCTADNLTTITVGTGSDAIDVPCYDQCTPVQTDDSLEFLNRCSDGSQTAGGVASDVTPWTIVLPKLGAGCKRVGPGCALPDLP